MHTPAKLTIGLFLTALVYFAGYFTQRQPVLSASANSSATLRSPSYTCPMHPHYKSDRPGDCPSCGMRLVARAADSDRPAPGMPGTVQVTAAQQQLIGLRTDDGREAPTSYTLRLPGRIAVDEGRLYRVIAGADGWIRELGQNSAG